MGAAIRIVHAAKGSSGPLRGYSFPGTRLGRHLPRLSEPADATRLIAAGKDRGRQADNASYAASDSRKNSIGRLGPTEATLHRQFELFTRGLNARSARAILAVLVCQERTIAGADCEDFVTPLLQVATAFIVDSATKGGLEISAEIETSVLRALDSRSFSVRHHAARRAAITIVDRLYGQR